MCVFGKDFLYLAPKRIGSLCLPKQTETVFCECLDISVLQHTMPLIAVKDIMLSVHLLECIFHVSEMGPTTCRKFVSILMLLVSVETVNIRYINSVMFFVLHILLCLVDVCLLLRCSANAVVEVV